MTKKTLFMIFALFLAAPCVFAANVNKMFLHTGTTYIISSGETFTGATVPSYFTLKHLDGRKFYSTSSNATNQLLLKPLKDTDSTIILYTKKHILMFQTTSLKTNPISPTVEIINENQVDFDIKVAPVQDKEDK